MAMSPETGSMTHFFQWSRTVLVDSQNESLRNVPVYSLRSVPRLLKNESKRNVPIGSFFLHIRTQPIYGDEHPGGCQGDQQGAGAGGKGAKVLLAA